MHISDGEVYAYNVTYRPGYVNVVIVSTGPTHSRGYWKRVDGSPELGWIQYVFRNELLKPHPNPDEVKLKFVRYALDKAMKGIEL